MYRDGSFRISVKQLCVMFVGYVTFLKHWSDAWVRPMLLIRNAIPYHLLAVDLPVVLYHYPWERGGGRLCHYPVLLGGSTFYFNFHTPPSIQKK